MRRFLLAFAAGTGLLIAIGCGVDAGLGLSTGPVATFTANPMAVTYTGVDVDIDLDASGSYVKGGGLITTYEWDYDYNGSTPSFTPDAAIHTHTYTQPGRYTILLQVTDDHVPPRTARHQLDIYIYPAADIAADRTVVCVGNDSLTDDSVSFTAAGSVVQSGDSITQYDWDFGDGTTVPDGGVTQAHAYTTPAASVTASVTIYTALGGSATASVNIKVVELTAQFTSPASGAPLTNVDVDASTSIATNTVITDYSWDWGDGTPAGSGVTASHQYSAAGNYTITLTITDENGFTDQETAPIVIADLAAIIYACDATTPPPIDTASVSGNQPLTVTFDDTHCVGAGIIEYAWDWECTDPGMNGFEDDFVADNTYGTPAADRSYVYSTSTTAVLRIFDGSNYAYDTCTISVTLPPLAADMVVDIAGSGATVSVDNNSTYYLNSTYETIPPAVPYVYVVLQSGVSGGSPANVMLDAARSTGDIIAYTFQWGDGTGDTIVNPPTTTAAHDYTAEGIYEVRVDVEDSSATHDYASLILAIVDTSAGHSYFSHLLDAGAGTGDQDVCVYEGYGNRNGYEMRINTNSGEEAYGMFQVFIDGEVNPSTETVIKGGIVLFNIRHNGDTRSPEFEVYTALGPWDETLVTWASPPGHPGYDSGTNFVDTTYTWQPLGGGNDERPVHPIFIPITSLLDGWNKSTITNDGAYIIANPVSGNIDFSMSTDGLQGNGRNPIIIGIKGP